MKTTTTAGLLIGLLIISGGIVTEASDIFSSLPEGVPGWTSTGEDTVYDRQTLYDYMNGGAEVYLAFDFRKVYVRKYRNPQDEEISLDVYDMGTSTEAFGIFSCDREDEAAGIGQGSEYGFGLLRFWKGRYFVSIMATSEEVEAEKAVLALGKAAAAALGPEGPEPSILTALPGNNLRRNRISYFHANVNLNNRYFIASENILRLESRTDCVIGEYGAAGDEPVSLLLVRYPDGEAARAAFGSFRSAYMPEADDSGLAAMEDGKWAMARLRDEVIVIVFDAPDRQTAQALHSEVKLRSNKD